MDRIEDIEVFVEVAGQGSFTAAARRLNRSPAAVTRAVADLEARLGVRLLNRTTRAVSLTEAGERFLGGARRVLADLTEIEQAAAGQGSAPRGELAVTAPILFGRLHVLPIVTEFMRAFPDVTARLMLLDRPVDLIEERLDAAIRIGPLADSSAIATRLGSLRRVVVAAPSYLARRGTPQRPAEIAAHDVVVFGGLGAAQLGFRRRRIGAVLAAADRDDSRGRDRRGREGLGLTRVLGYQAVDALARGAVRRSWPNSDARRARCICSIRAARIRRRSCAPSSISQAPKLRARLAAIAQALA